MKQPLSFLVLPACLVLFPGLAGAESKRPWKDVAEISVLSTTGNSFTRSISAKNDFTYEWERVGLSVFGGGLGAKSDGKVTAEQYNAGEKLSWKSGDHNYLFERFQWDKNRFAGIDNRYDFGAGIGRKLVKRERHDLLGEIGGGYIKEERIGSKDVSFGSGRAYSKYGFKISETADLTQDLEFLHNFEDNEDYRLNAETSLIAALSTHFSIKVSYLWKRVGKPPTGFVRDDTTTGVSLIANF